MSSKHCRHAGEADREPYHYTACGLDNVWLLSGYDITSTRYGDAVTIRHLDDLHRLIACGLVTEKKILSGPELRFLRKEMGLSQLELATRLRMSDQAVARWEKGENEMPGPADILVRVLYCEHIGVQLDTSFNDLANVLAEKDAGPDTRLEFEETDSGWRALAA